MWSYILIGVAFVIFLLFFLRLSQKKNDQSLGPFQLETQPTIAPVDSAQTLINKGNTGTFQVFIFPSKIQKTGQISKCTEDGIANPGDPDCSSGQYGICPCVNSDCSPCRHKGYLNILNVSNTVRIEVLTAPDASRQKAAGTQMVVRTVGVQNDSQKYFEETIVLPDIPYQRWTMITIAREGRRFDVYYNDNLVSSTRTQYILDNRIAFKAIVAGDKDLHGQVALVEVFPNKLSLSEVQKNYRTKATTTGEPILPEKVDLETLIPICKDGNCLQGPAVKPANPLMDWQSNYA